MLPGVVLTVERAFVEWQCTGVGGHHPTYELQDVIVLDSTHPITKGVTDFKVYDEQHFTFIDEHRGAQVSLVTAFLMRETLCILRVAYPV